MNVYEEALVALLGVMERQGMEAGQLLRRDIKRMQA